MSSFWGTVVSLTTLDGNTGLLISLFFKGSLILLLAAMINSLLRKKSAAVRHWIWSLAFISLLLILPLSSFLPEKPLPLLPQVHSSELEKKSLYQTPGAGKSQPSMKFEPIETDSSSPRNRSNHEESVKFQKEQTAIYTKASGIQAPLSRESVPPAKKEIRWPLLVFWVWITGGIYLLTRFFLSILRIHRMPCKGEEVRDENLGHLLRECMECCRVRGSVKLVVHSQIPVPAALGLFRPVLILPEDVYEWSEETQRSVFCHELAHVKRFDFLTNVLVQISCALNWFNPLVWITMRQFLIEREKACDDFVIQGGAPNCEYAELLLGIAQNLPRINNLRRCALVLAHHSGLKNRIKHILSLSAKRKTLTWRVLFVTAVVVMLFIIPLTMARIEVREFQEEAKIWETKSLKNLIQDLKNHNPKEQKRAAWALGDREDKKAVPALIEALKDKNPEIRGMAAWALGEIKEMRALSPLIEALPDENDYTREMIIKAVGELMNERGVEPLVVFLDDKNQDVRAAAVWALGEIPCQESQDAILSVLDDSSALVRDSVVIALAKFQNQQSVKNLIPMLKDRETKIRERTAFELGILKEKQAVDALIESLKDKEVNVRFSAAIALGKIGDSTALDSLMELLRDENARVRDAVVWALDEISLK
jgi:HEAT repeat protein/beta-lactamase regulating signal transducer with metallopeptidase domain